MPRVLGIDIGSRTVDAVWLDGAKVIATLVEDTGYEPGAVCTAIASRMPSELVAVTGYGRRLAAERFGGPVLTEIKAFAVGARHLYPAAAAILDIGGQDTKVIALGGDGQVADFEMNDKCAAGTGRFLEVMARALGFAIDKLGAAALSAPNGGAPPVTISSMCTVFAESEIIGLLHRGGDRRAIAAALCRSVAKRALAVLRSMRARGPLVFAGGGAKNAALVQFIKDGFDGEVIVPDDSQIVGALGAAICGMGVLEGHAPSVSNL